MCSYYRRFVPKFAVIAEPLSHLTRKDSPFVWGKEQVQAFETLKSALINYPVLAHYDPLLPLELRTDASLTGLGIVVVQKHPEGDRVVAYASRTLLPPETRYSVPELECLAAVWAVTRFRPYVYGRHFKIISDHACLHWLKRVVSPNMRLARWMLTLQGFDFTIE